ncbi:Fusaric acid resistance protein-like-domain-containing protein [Kockovaella imperatae]|uniref:Fusaric acid resistance protein-like-domain-containing protein n=1 Tax=Kockovaella imperatae TaxID=4999 RepID=A0A1Y1UK19_9TREE|nr:Fusaric acid resistance protein-like-domain-containing protein [Kockovaella imperatae]ORX38403.1 Fusaric acid resistance protein-like-domain-containing protein [Kockovaella imperatae]
MAQQRSSLGVRASDGLDSSSGRAGLAQSLPAQSHMPARPGDSWSTPRAGSSRHVQTRSVTTKALRALGSGDRDSFDNWHALRDMDDDDNDKEEASDPLRSSGFTRRLSVATAIFIPNQSTGFGEQRANVWSSSPSIAKNFSSSPPRISNGFDELISGRMEEGSDSVPRSERRSGHGDRLDGTSVPIKAPGARQTVPWQEKVKSLSPVFVAIFKCSLAYTLASLFTFVPRLSRVLSTTSETDAHGRITPVPNYSAHMVATVVVYYNPAKSIGGMLLATRFCIILASFATLVSLGAMGTLWLFDQFSPSHGDKWDWVSEIGDWIVCVVWVGGSMGTLAFARVWVGNPNFNTGCSMAAITIYTVVIKEGLIPKLLEVLLIVLMAACVTNLVCFVVFPVSATTRLQLSISKSLTSFSTLLDRLCATFLLEKTVVKGSHTTLRDAVTSHAAAFKNLKADLAEAKHERVVDTRIRGRHMELYDAAIESLARLAQHLAGLRGSTKLQEGLLRAAREGRIRLDHTQLPSISPTMLKSISSDFHWGGIEDGDLQTSIKLLMQFQEIAGSQMRQLVSRCDDALEAVQAVTHRSTKTVPSLSEVRSDLASSLTDFNRYSSRAIKRLYAGPRRQKEYMTQDLDDNDDDSLFDPDDMLQGPNETVFLIYFFLFTLEEFARELIFLIDTVSEILEEQPMSALDYLWSVLPSRRGRTEKRGAYLYKQLRKIVPVDPSKLQPPLFPRSQADGEENYSITFTLWERFRKRLWTMGEFLRRPNIRYALKAGIGGAILAAPAYTEAGRPIFLRYRGEWALIAYISAINPTVGATNLISVFRVIGTIIGASVAVGVYTLFPENAVVLPILGCILSIPAFYVITQMPGYAQAGRFTLLAYNLTCLYAFNSREREISPLSIAIRRSTSVVAGVVWAAIVSRYWWPYTARRELRIGLSDFFLDLSYLYSKLVTTYSHGNQTEDNTVKRQSSETEPLLPTVAFEHSHLGPGIRQFMSMELHLQGQLQSLRARLAETKNEPRLKGPFAYDFYKEALLSCERMLDRLHSMRCVTTREEWDNGIREAFVLPVNPQRREMVGNVILYFYTLSAGFQLRTPMPPYLPPAEDARRRLVEAIRGLDVVRKRSVRGGGRHLLYFAYASAMQEVIVELEYLGKMMQDSFGVISQSTVEDFEALFNSGPGSDRTDPQCL